MVSAKANNHPPVMELAIKTPCFNLRDIPINPKAVKTKTKTQRTETTEIKPFDPSMIIENEIDKPETIPKAARPKTGMKTIVMREDKIETPKVMP
jgi:hypothetical protein